MRRSGCERSPGAGRSELPGGVDEVAVGADARRPRCGVRALASPVVGLDRAAPASRAIQLAMRTANERKSRPTALAGFEIILSSPSVAGPSPLGRPLALRTRLATGVPLSGYVSRMCIGLLSRSSRVSYAMALDLQAFFRGAGVQAVSRAIVSGQMSPVDASPRRRRLQVRAAATTMESGWEHAQLECPNMPRSDPHEAME